MWRNIYSRVSQGQEEIWTLEKNEAEEGEQEKKKKSDVYSGTVVVTVSTVIQMIAFRVGRAKYGFTRDVTMRWL
jgi:hypothetical protein